jgi:enamine deaminase RidA (YjgF/YER057c/UK114 family)
MRCDRGGPEPSVADDVRNAGLYRRSKVPTDIAGQSELAWENVLRVLSKADMTVGDIVKVTQCLTRAEDIKAYSQVRNRFLASARPARMLLVIPQLVWPNLLVEVEIIAAKGS